jgi:hypothetical protein
MSGDASTDRLRAKWEKYAPRYDRDIGFFERVQFGGGREWVCSQAGGFLLLDGDTPVGTFTGGSLLVAVWPIHGAGSFCSARCTRSTPTSAATTWATSPSSTAAHPPFGGRDDPGQPWFPW